MLHKKYILLLLFATFSIPLAAQQFLVTGKVTNTKLEGLGFATVQLKKQQLGTRTDLNGNYKFKLEEGEYDLVFSLLGFKTQTIKIIVHDKDIIQNIILDENTRNISEVKIVATKKNKAEEYIRQVIEHKKENEQAVNSYSCNVYIKAVEENKRDNKQKEPTVQPYMDSLAKIKHQLDSARTALNTALNSMNMAEIYLRLDYVYPNKIKEERLGVKRRGNTESLFYLSNTEGNFSLYQNLIQVPALSESPMLSPISYSGLIAYKFKIIKTEKRNACTFYTIKFSPIKSGNALIEGTVEIVDTSWTITDATYSFPSHLMAEYNSFAVRTSYEFIQQKAWMLDRMELTYLSKEGKTKHNGSTVVVYDDYKLDTTFKKKYFGTELSSTAQEAYDKDSNFWNTVRKEPLSEKELSYIRKKDSVYYAKHTTAYLDSIDKVNNKITVRDIFVDGVSFYKRENDRTIYFNPLLNSIRILLPGGTRLGYGGSYAITPKSKRTFYTSIDLMYGLAQKDVLGNWRISKRYNPFTNGYFAFDCGRNYDLVFGDDSYINILRRSNFYLKQYANIEHGVELFNGFILRNKLEFANRIPVDINKSDSTIDKLLGDLGADSANYAKFNAYNAFYNSITLEYTPRQMYMREPRQKIILGSKYPTAYATLRTGVPGVFNSAINFNYLEFGIKQKIKLGLAGISEYKIFTGSFLSKHDLKSIDYKFMRRGDPRIFNEPTRNFQLLDSSFPVFHRFYEGHYLHQFNGSIINKIPYAKYLHLYEVAGGGALYLPERKLIYFEAFAGLEKPFKLFGEKFKIGAYVAASIANKFNNPFQLKFGLQHYDKENNKWE